MDLVDIPGLAALWAQTLGDRRIGIAILDGPVDRKNRCSTGASLDQYSPSRQAFEEHSCSISHGTEIASVIFAQHDSRLRGIAPGCRGLSVPIFECSPVGPPTTGQVELATAMRLARDASVQVINISAGQLVTDELVESVLLDAVRECAAARVLVVAAAGNDGCDCLHLPAALPNVLSVGAATRNGQPLASSNWGSIYRAQGILAPGQNVPVAGAGGDLELRTGTSYAAAIVSGVVGLLLSRQLQMGRPVDSFLVRDALLATAIGRDAIDDRRFLAGRLNIPGALSYLDDRSTMMNDETRADTAIPTTVPSQTPLAQPVRHTGLDATASHHADTQCSPRGHDRVADFLQPSIQPSACSACRGERQLVYALGQLGYDFGTEPTLDAFKQRMRIASEQYGSPMDERHLLHFLKQTCDKEPWHATSFLWTLNLSGVPQYVIRPEGPYARECYQRLREFFDEQVNGDVERVAIPGTISGQATLLYGRTVPVVVPDLRGFCN